MLFPFFVLIFFYILFCWMLSLQTFTTIDGACLNNIKRVHLLEIRNVDLKHPHQNQYIHSPYVYVKESKHTWLFTVWTGSQQNQAKKAEIFIENGSCFHFIYRFLFLSLSLALWFYLKKRVHLWSALCSFVNCEVYESCLTIRNTRNTFFFLIPFFSCYSVTFLHIFRFDEFLCFQILPMLKTWKDIALVWRKDCIFSSQQCITSKIETSEKKTAFTTILLMLQ